ncbi:MAG: hypothetical protein IKO41_07835 [Lachnospiraceae bacterium]|nr:hypothetical protein [Lachnospiraceae bacterium]
MSEKVRPGKKAFVLVVAAVALSVIMAVSSVLSPDLSPGREMVTAAPRSGIGGGSEQLPNCVRCGGTDCVIWLPQGADVAEDSVTGLADGISWAVLTTDAVAFDDELRKTVAAASVNDVPGTNATIRVTSSESGYVGRERVVYEEMRVREKVSLKTRDGFYFTYLLHAENGAGIVITASCDGSRDASRARDLLYAMAASFQRGDEQQLEVREAILREAKTGSVTGEIDPDSLYETETNYAEPEEGLEDPSGEDAASSDAGAWLEIDADFSVRKDAKKGSALVVTWANKTVSPDELYVVTPSGELLAFDEEQSLDGVRVFWVTGDEPADGWRIYGRTSRQMGETYPIMYSAEEYADAYWN